MNISEPVLLDFFSEYCNPCKMLAKDLDEISKKYNDLKIEKLDIMENYELTEKYNIMSVPTLILIKDDKTASYIGYKGKDDLEKFLEENL